MFKLRILTSFLASHALTPHTDAIYKNTIHTKITPLAHNHPQPSHETNRTHTHPSIESVHPRRGEMSAADPQGSPSNRGGGSSSTPLGAGSQPELIGMDDSKAVLVITPTLVYDMKGEVYALLADIVLAVDHFTVPDGYKTEGSCERSFMYSLGDYVVALEEEDGEHKYFCLADATCRKNKTTVPCKKGDRSNVNTHRKGKILSICVLYVGYIQNHTPGHLPAGYYPTKNSCKFFMTFMPVPGTSESSVRPWPQYYAR